MIVKVQRPLESSEKNPPALVYNEDRTAEEFIEFDAKLQKIMGDREKIYCEARYDKTVFILERVVADQEW